MMVAIDAGHGGSDPGAVGPAGTREADVCLAIGLLLKGLLEGHGWEAVITRDGDDDCAGAGADAAEELQARCDIANDAGADCFISIHCNAAENPEACGTETWYYDAGRPLAASVQKALGRVGLVDRGIKAGGFYVLKYTEMPAALAEVGFISNAAEEALLSDGQFQRSVAEALLEGIRGLGEVG